MLSLLYHLVAGDPIASPKLRIGAWNLNTTLYPGGPNFHRENGGLKTLGMGALIIINPINTSYPGGPKKTIKWS